MNKYKEYILSVLNQRELLEQLTTAIHIEREKRGKSK